MDSKSDTNYRYAYFGHKSLYESWIGKMIRIMDMQILDTKLTRIMGTKNDTDYGYEK